jgi:PAS domain S-box-containing protein
METIKVYILDNGSAELNSFFRKISRIKGNIQVTLLTEEPASKNNLQIDRCERAKSLLKTKYEGFSNLIEDLIFLVKLDDPTNPGKIVEINNRVVEKLGYSYETLLSKSFYSLMSDPDCDFGIIRADLMLKGRCNFNSSLVGSDGSVLPVEIWMKVLDLQGDIVTMVVARDQSSYEKIQAELQWRLEFEKVISNVSGILKNYEDIDRAIDKALAELCRLTGADRSYVFLFDHESDFMSNTHEWCREGVESEKETLQKLPLSDYPWWMKELQRGEVMNIVVDELPENAKPEAEVMRRQKIQSLVVVPIFTRQKLVGFAGLDSLEGYFEWNDADIELLKVFVSLISEVVGYSLLT